MRKRGGFWKASKAEHQFSVHRSAYISAIILTLTIIITALFLRSGPSSITGMVAGETEVYTITAGLNITQASSYLVTMTEEPGGIYISGYFEGSGRAIAYIHHNGQRLAIFDTDAWKETHLVPAQYQKRLYFENECRETCQVRGLGQNLTLSVEIDNMSVYLSQIVYTKALAEEVSEPARAIFGYKVQNNPPACRLPRLSIYRKRNISIDLARYCNDADGDTLNFSASFQDGFQHSIRGSRLQVSVPIGFRGASKAAIMASDGIATYEENISIDVLESISQHNESTDVDIEVGEHSQWKKIIMLGQAANGINTTLPNNARDVAVKVLPDQSGTFSQVEAGKLSLLGSGVTMDLPAFERRNTAMRLSGKISSYEHRKAVGWKLGRSKDMDERLAALRAELLALGNETLTEYIDTDEVLLQIDEPGIGYEIEYSTYEPDLFEMDITDERKLVTIASEERYSDVLVSTLIADTSRHWINVSWLMNSSRYQQLIDQYGLEGYPACNMETCRFNIGGIEDFNLTYIDSDGNGFIDELRWIVPHLSNETFEVENNITIINVQSYPTVGKNWEVQFNTTGIANLTITPVYGTQFGVDLDFKSLRCGSKQMDADYNASRVFYEMYDCQEAGYERSLVKTPGAHTLEFMYGNDVKYAFNEAEYHLNVSIYVEPDPALAGTNTTVHGRLVSGELGVGNVSLNISLDDARLYHNTTIGMLVMYDTEVLPKTDTDGYYNYAFEAPADAGLHGMRVNASYNGSYTENSTDFIVSSPSLLVWAESVSSTVYVLEQDLFYANYSYAGLPIDNQSYGGACSIRFNLSMGWTQPQSMQYNATSKMYEYNRSFDEPMQSIFNVSCEAGGLEGAVNTSSFIIIGIYPEIHSVNITNTIAYANDSLNCSANVSFIQGEYAYVNFTWFVDGMRNMTADTSVNCTVDAMCYTDALLSGLRKHSNYTCSAAASGGYGWSNWSNSSALEAQNSPPSLPARVIPSDGDDKLTARRPTFRWNASQDADGDYMQYFVNITNDVCANIHYATGNLEFVPDEDLCTHDETVSNPYLWIIRAFDGEDYSGWTSAWNFSIESVAMVELNSGFIDFGTLTPGNATDTTSDGTFIIENTGTIKLNVSIAANNPFESVALGTKHFQTAVNATDEPGSFQWDSSVTYWTNMTYTFQHLIAYLNHTESVNEAKIALRIEVPLNEPPGAKSSTITIMGEQA